MSMTYAESQRLIRELTEITVNPEKHNQMIWLEADENPEETACGTTGCLAGNAVLHAGDKLLWEPKTRYDHDQDRYVFSGKYEAKHCKVGDNIVSIASRAQALFGLTGYQREEMFAPHVSISELWNLAIEYSGGLIDVGDAISAYSEKVRKLESEITDRDSKLAALKTLLG